MIGHLNRSKVVQSKLNIPPLRQEFVYRPQIANLLNESLRRKLTIISSPAGYGKTSLVCEWLLGIHCKAAWLSLDAADNDPVRYWNHLVHALEQAIPNYFQRSRAWLQSGRSDISDPLLIPLLNEMSMLDDPLVLILDDYHLIQSEDIHRTMSYLIRHLPETIHIIMLTRGVAPFPLGRLKVNRELHEIGREELTFKEEECRKLFSAMGVDHLSDLEIHELNQLTEGWVAVLCVIAAHASNTPGFKFLYAINPNLMQVFDYFYEKLLVTIESDLQLFLLRTSIFERMCPELCEDITGRKDAHVLLTQLERSNAFITQIEPSEQWYRYHLVFRDFLYNQLKKQFPEEIRFLHEKAAKWFASKKLMEEAINHAIASSLWDLAAEWIDEYAPALIQSKRTSTIELWFQQIPKEIFAAYPEFPVVRGWTYAVIGKIDLALADWQTLSSKLQDVSVESPRRLRQLAIEMHMIEAAIAISKQNLEGTIAASMKAMPMLPLQTRYYPATEEYTGSRLFISREKSGFWGHLSKSFVLYGGFREVFEEQKVPLQGYNASMLAEIAYERNLFCRALHFSDLGAISGYQTKTASVFIPSMLVRVRVMKAIRSAEGFHAEWKRLEEGMRHIGADVHWQDLILAFQVREVLKDEASGVISEWLGISRLTERGDLSVAREYEYGTLIRVLLWQNRLAEAEKLLDGFRALMAAEDRYAHLLELDLLRTVLYAKKGDLGHALSLLDKTIELAAPEGYIRIFLDEGQDIIRLLFKSAKLHSANQSPNASYLQLLLDSLQESATHETEGDPSNEKLLETLSQREIDILNCINRGMTNLQIGEKLGLSEGTVKGYNNQLYAKLGVRNRTQAIERARGAGILL